MSIIVQHTHTTQLLYPSINRQTVQIALSEFFFTTVYMFTNGYISNANSRDKVSTIPGVYSNLSISISCLISHLLDFIILYSSSYQLGPKLL